MAAGKIGSFSEGATLTKGNAERQNHWTSHLSPLTALRARFLLLPNNTVWRRGSESNDSCSIYGGKMTFLPNGSSYLCHS